MSGAWSHVCGAPTSALPAPDKDSPCCWTAAETDGKACECWEEIYWPPPTPDILAGPMATRTRLCHDCAYRPGSPERAEEDGEQLDAVLYQPFTCHQGMPVLVGYRHPQIDGLSMLARGLHDRDNFGPVTRGAQAWKANGSPAELCAGWAGVLGLRRIEKRLP